MSMTMTLRQHPNKKSVEHHVVADFGSGAFDLLLMRMGALQLEPEEVRRIESDVFGDLAEACAKCESKDRCEWGLRSAGAVEHDWESCCPNATTLRALAALLSDIRTCETD